MGGDSNIIETLSASNGRFFCSYAGVCSGCSWIQKPFENQTQEKIEDFAKTWREGGLEPSLLPEISIQKIAEGGLRDRVDMTIQRKDGRVVFGLYDVDRKDIVDIKSCPQMSDELAKWFHEFRSDLPDLKLGSVRLRVAPDGPRGVWLDFPNVEIKRFLEERDWLLRLSEKAHVEIGQRRKVLSTGGDRLKLEDPVLNSWFETYLGEDEKPQPLYCTIGSFTQTGFQANRVLIQEVRRTLDQCQGEVWAELCAGVGNFTLSLASLGKKVLAVELDRLALNGMKESLDESQLSAQVEILRSNIHRPNEELKERLKNVDGVLVDPPRSGLKQMVDLFSDKIIQPANIIYVSCFSKSLIEDTKVLLKSGYELISVRGVDQFPQSPHCEWVTLFRRKTSQA